MTARRKLTTEDVLLIRALRAERDAMRAKLAEITQKKVAEKFGVEVTAIAKIENYRTYIDIP